MNLYGVEMTKARLMIENNKHNQITTTYYLLLKVVEKSQEVKITRRSAENSQHIRHIRPPNKSQHANNRMNTETTTSEKSKLSKLLTDSNNTGRVTHSPFNNAFTRIQQYLKNNIPNRKSIE